MATDSSTIDELDILCRPGRWDFLFSWTSLLLIAWVLYELTSQAFLGVTVFCCKFGWEDFRTAIWLRRKDPIAARGKMEMWIYLAAGLCCVGSIAFIIMLAMAIIAGVLQLPAPEDQLKEAGLTALVGCTICILTTMRALSLAWWHQRKLWFHPAMHLARTDDLWPPFPLRRRDGSRLDLDGKNKAGIVIGFVFFITVVPILFTIIILTGVIAANEVKIIVFYLFLMFGYPMLFLWLRKYQQRYLLAQRPEECWGVDEVVEVLKDESGIR